MVLIRGHNVRLTVQRAAGGAEDDLAHRVVEARAQNIEAADHVHLRVVARIGDGFRHFGLSRVVIDDLGAERRNGRLDLRQLTDVNPEQACGGIDVFFAPCGQVVEHRHVVARGDIGVDDM